MKETDILSNPSIMIIFTYAPAGLGHLRVTDSLYHGLPGGISPVLLGSQDKSVALIHRIMSVHPMGRSMMEFFQRGVTEDFFTMLYRMLLRSGTAGLYRQLETLLKQRITLPQTVLVVATHFGLAHQIAEIKEKLKSEENTQVFLLVCVTDDSPQHVWYVPGADLTFVPSRHTRNQLIEYGHKYRLPKIQFEVLPYPVSPLLAKPHTSSRYDLRIKGLTPTGNSQTQIAIPISGAAVGMKYFTQLIYELNHLSKRFTFHVISKISPFTQVFLQEMEKITNVHSYAFFHDRQVVDSYEKVYQKEVICLEVTKPSEQAFKALISPKGVGGSVLLFSQPVGRQEYDNLQFLEKHGLIADKILQKKLRDKASANASLQNPEGKKILNIACFWRGLRLTEDPQESARFINWCLESGLFLQMVQYHKLSGEKNTDSLEVSSRGVEIFWQKTAEFLQTKILG